MEKRKKRSRILIVTLCVAAVILVTAGIVAGPGRMLMVRHNKAKITAAHEAQVRENKAKLNDDEYVQAQIMDYLEERYHEKFVMKSYKGDWLQNIVGYRVSMEVWPEGKEDDEHLFEVKGYRNDEGILDYSDSYVYLRLKKEMAEYFQPYIDEYYDEYLSYYVFFPLERAYKSNLQADISVEELLKLEESTDYAKPCLCVELQVEPQEDCHYDVMAALAKRLQDNQFRGELEISLFGENKKFYQSFSFFIYDEKIGSTEYKKIKG